MELPSGSSASGPVTRTDLAPGSAAFALHAFVRRIDDDELRGSVHFGVLALVVLPLMPEGP